MTRVDDAQYRESEIQIQTPFKLISYMHDGKMKQQIMKISPFKVNRNVHRYQGFPFNGIHMQITLKV